MTGTRMEDLSDGVGAYLNFAYSAGAMALVWGRHELAPPKTVPLPPTLTPVSGGVRGWLCRLSCTCAPP